MRRTLIEETVLMASVAKWIVLATIAGAAVGVATAVFLHLLSMAVNATGRYPYAFLFLPAAFFLSSLLIRYLAPDAEGHGTEKVIEAVHKSNGNIPLAVVPVKLLATIITLAFGGSAGKEGPCAQIGAGICSWMSRIMKFNEDDRKKLVICGISAGFAAVFGTPIAGAIFGVEVLFVGSILYDVLLPSFIAGITSYQIASWMGIPYLRIPMVIMPDVNQLMMLKIIASVFAFGILSRLLILGLKIGHRCSSAIRIWKPGKALIGGFTMVLLALLFGRTWLGLGIESIDSALGGAIASWYTPLLKILFTSVTLSLGGSGGIVTPIFFIGATGGSALAALLRFDPVALSAVGFVSLLAGAANTPIAASIMAVELFGPSIGPYAAVACVVSFIVSGHRSVYPSQILAVKKSPSLATEIGRDMASVRTMYLKKWWTRLWRSGKGRKHQS
ncbi:MAG: chloride channel protein [Candidatus Wallbacteria bacterium]|nr:chloride channel protein [Candidatus Wallbacteria bacterium]